MLMNWTSGSVSKLLSRLQNCTHLKFTPAQIENFRNYLDAHQLLIDSKTNRQLSQTVTPTSFSSIAMKLLFFRIRLFNPEKAAHTLKPFFGMFFSPAAILLLLIFALFSGLVLIQKEYDLGVTVAMLATPKGFAALIPAMILSKFIHEFGHAIASVRNGVAPTSMGVLLVLGAPLAYTDVTDSWRLDRQRDRLVIAAGGIIAESWLALAAVWGWLILPHGPARSVCLYLAAGGLLTTLLINCNPFLKFDGYYILSDILGIENLRQKSNKMGKWLLRGLLLGWHTQPPEPQLTKDQHYLLAFWGWLSWLVKASIYFGLSLAVYIFFTKSAGIILMALVISQLLIKPVLTEIATVWKNRAAFLYRPRILPRLLLAAGAAFWFVIPLHHHLEMPALLIPAERLWIYPPRPAILTSWLPSEKTVLQTGTTIASFHSPKIKHDLQQSSLRVDMLTTAMQQVATSTSKIGDKLILEEQIARENSSLSGYTSQQASLHLTIPFRGFLVQSDPALKQQLNMHPEQPLFLAVSSRPWTIKAYILEEDLKFTSVFTDGSFYPECPDFPVMYGKIIDISSTPIKRLTEPVLSSLTGGDILVNTEKDGTLIPRRTYYEASIELRDNAPQETILRGTFTLESKPMSLLSLVKNRLTALVVRELQF